MSLTNPKTVVTEERLAEFYQQILPYLGGMPEMLANKFSKSDLYSTDEKMIGQWIDGKPLYQKTIQNTLPNADTNGTEVFKYIQTGVSIDDIINISLMFKKATGNCFSGSMFLGGASYSIGYRVFCGHNASQSHKNEIALANSNTGWNGETVYITFQYTKTTDSPVAIGIDTDYSTEEKIVGTWIDGKPLYQKTVALNSPIDIGASDQWINIMSVAGWNIDKLINGKFYNLSSGVWSGQSLSLYAGIIDNTLKVVSLSVTGGTVTHITLQYTKTTD